MKRILSFLFVTIILFSGMNLAVFADETNNSSDSSAEDSSSSASDSSASDSSDSSADSEGSKAAVSIPEPSAEYYVLDEAAVLTETTKNTMIETAKRIDETYNIQIVVATVKSTGGSSIEDYCYSLFHSWKIGKDDAKGLLFLLDTEDDTYTAMAGAGIKDKFTSDKLKSMLDTYMEPDFSAKKYDAGATKIFNEAVSQTETFFANTDGTSTDSSTSSEADKKSEGGSAFGTIITVVIVIVVLLILGIAIIYVRGQAVKKKRRAARAARTRSRTTATYEKPLSRESYYTSNSKYSFDEFSSRRGSTRSNSSRSGSTKK